MKIYNLMEKEEYIKEVVFLAQLEWGKKLEGKELELKIERKIKQIKSYFGRNDYCKLLLIDNQELIGFISIFPFDGEECSFTPWYATMYVKEQYRGKGYSRILNDAILKEAKKRGYQKIYLKTTLNNYYEKFGAKYLKKLKTNEKLYYFDLKD